MCCIWVLHEIYYSCIHSLEIFKRTEILHSLLSSTKKTFNFHFCFSSFVSHNFFFENKSRQHMRYISFINFIHIYICFLRTFLLPDDTKYFSIWYILNKKGKLNFLHVFLCTLKFRIFLVWLCFKFLIFLLTS